jgi:uncharacterized protein (TIGR01777 family)
MRVAITGSSGTIGRTLMTAFPQAIPLKRDALDTPIDNLDVLINLAGANIMFSRKQEILSSRVETTKKIVAAQRPKVLISASAIGFYGNNESADESSPQGSGFLAEVCHQWEEEAKKAKEYGARVVLLRMGIVLTPTGGALKMMLPAFKLGLGAVLGTGNQWMSWISLEDLLRIVAVCIENNALQGPVNAVSPTPITNRDFTKTLADSLHRPAFMRIPEWALHLALGNMADETLLSSCKALPKKLQVTGFEFNHPTLQRVLPIS